MLKVANSKTPCQICNTSWTLYLLTFTFTKLIVTKKQIPILTNNYTVLQVNVNNNDSDQEKICTTASQNVPPNEKETSKKTTKKNKNSLPECKRIYI